MAKQSALAMNLMLVINQLPHPNTYVKNRGGRVGYQSLFANFRAKRGTDNRVLTIAGAFDYKKGKGVAAFNGEHRALSANLKQHARNMGLKVGECIGRITVGRCAEFRAADKLSRRGSRINNIRWTYAYFVDSSDSGFLVIGNKKDYCDACQQGFSLRN